MATNVYPAKINIPQQSKAEDALKHDATTLKADYQSNKSEPQKQHDLAQVAADYASAHPNDTFEQFSNYVTKSLGVKDASQDLKAMQVDAMTGTAYDSMNDFLAGYQQCVNGNKGTFDKNGNATKPDEITPENTGGLPTQHGPTLSALTDIG